MDTDESNLMVPSLSYRGQIILHLLRTGTEINGFQPSILVWNDELKQYTVWYNCSKKEHVAKMYKQLYIQKQYESQHKHQYVGVGAFSWCENKQQYIQAYQCSTCKIVGTKEDFETGGPLLPVVKRLYEQTRFVCQLQTILSMKQNKVTGNYRVTIRFKTNLSPSPSTNSDGCVDGMFLLQPNGQIIHSALSVG